MPPIAPSSHVACTSTAPGAALYALSAPQTPGDITTTDAFLKVMKAAFESLDAHMNDVDKYSQQFGEVFDRMQTRLEELNGRVLPPFNAEGARVLGTPACIALASPRECLHPFRAFLTRGDSASVPEPATDVVRSIDHPAALRAPGERARITNGGSSGRTQAAAHRPGCRRRRRLPEATPS
eukprot:1382564-Pleurochrysis_carterae.AAC.2